MTDVVSHLAGTVVEYHSAHGTLVRQRCQWCGAVLVDANLDRVAVAVMPGEDPPDVSVPTWEPHRFVDVIDPDGTGGMSASNPWPGDGPAPETACLRMPPEATA